MAALSVSDKRDECERYTNEAPKEFSDYATCLKILLEDPGKGKKRPALAYASDDWELPYDSNEKIASTTITGLPEGLNLFFTAFQDYLLTIHANENFLFYHEVNELRTMPTGTPKKDIDRKIAWIFAKFTPYIGDGGGVVNLEFSLTQTFIRMTRGQIDNPQDDSVWTKASREVAAMLNGVPSWAISKQYSAMIDTKKKKIPFSKTLSEQYKSIITKESKTKLKPKTKTKSTFARSRDKFMQKLSLKSKKSHIEYDNKLSVEENANLYDINYNQYSSNAADPYHHLNNNIMPQTYYGSNNGYFQSDATLGGLVAVITIILFLVILCTTILCCWLSGYFIGKTLRQHEHKCNQINHDEYDAGNTEI